jgi:hypothetical protein
LRSRRGTEGDVRALAILGFSLAFGSLRVRISPIVAGLDTLYRFDAHPFARG